MISYVYVFLMCLLLHSQLLYIQDVLALNNVFCINNSMIHTLI